MTAAAEIPRPKRAPGLFVTDEELLDEFRSVPRDVARRTIQFLDAHRDRGFPRKNPMWADRRYLPAVKSWLLHTNLPKLVQSVEGGDHD